VWILFIFLRKGTDNLQKWTSWSHTGRNISWPADRLLASQDGQVLCSMELEQ
jgi:hypothetical protein